MARRRNTPADASGSNIGGIAAERLRSFIERLERMDEEIDALKQDRKQIVQEAKSTGFDARTIAEILKLRKLSPDERDEREALLDIYKAALGMLADTPLGAAAIKRLSPKPPPRPDGEDPDGEDDDAGSAAPPSDDIEEALAPPSGTPEPTVEEAHAMGAAAAAAGQPVTANPFPAGDRRRAAWDESWCHASGSDGMDLPEAWRRARKPKPDPKGGDPKGDDE